MGTIADFYRRLGPEFNDLKFKPVRAPSPAPCRASGVAPRPRTSRVPPSLLIRARLFEPQTYNPYTEPSMEFYSYHDGLGKWVEVGNSGVFRPEMLRPMGFDEDVTVIAWGMSLERPTMIKYGFNNIRDLFSHKIDLGLVRNHPIVVWN